MTRDVWSSDTVNLAGWTLLNLCWQGAVVGATAFAALRALRGASPSARYGVALAAFAVLLFVPVGTAARLAFPHEGDARVAMGLSNDTPPIANVEPARRPASASSELSPAALEVPKIPFWRIERQRWIGALAPGVPTLLVVWFAGVLAFGVRLLLDVRQAWRLRQGSECVPADEIQTTVLRIAEEIGISRRVAVVISPTIQGPVVVGVLSPTVLVPLRLASGLTSIQLDLLLAHELAHIRRRDHLVNALQAFAEVAFFFQPAIWWISRVLRDEREHCCDAAAARRAGGPYELAQALLLLEEHRGQTKQRLVMAARSGSLLLRVRRLVAPGAARTAGGISTAAAAAIIVVGLWVTTAAAAARPIPSVVAATPTPLAPTTPAIASPPPDSTPSAPSRTAVVVHQSSDSVRTAPGNVPPRYPNELKTAGVEGSVLVEFTVDTLGRAKMDGVAVLSSAHESFSASVRVALAAMRFIPATRNGRRIEQTVDLPFQFSMARPFTLPESATTLAAIGQLGLVVVTAMPQPSSKNTLRLESIVITAPPAPSSTTVDGNAVARTVPDVRASPKRGNSAPRYPDALRAAAIDGEVIAQFIVDEQGRADLGSFVALRSTDPLFASSVRDAIGAWLFTPAELNGQPTKQIVQMPVQFSIARH